jgi:NCAIR mutase (PurE)-related protein
LKISLKYPKILLLGILFNEITHLKEFVTFAKKLRLEDKRKAIELRLQGKSYKEIMNVIPNLSKSTLFGWVKNLKLTPEQEEKLRARIGKITYNARVKAVWMKKKKKQENIQKI